jgi:hypothetical protein
MDGVSHYIVLHSENKDGEYISHLKARNGEDVQDLLQAVIFEVADTIGTDPLTLAKSLYKHLESVLTPQSSGEIN